MSPVTPPARVPFGAAPRLALLVGVVLALYLAWAKSGFNYDDRVEFINVAAPDSAGAALRLLGEPSYPGLPYYRPLTKASLLVQKSISGLNPLPFHVANALFAALAALGAYAVLRVPTMRVPPLLALLGAAIFALHPIASSCVYPASGGRYSLLAAVFMLGAMGAFLRAGRGSYFVAMVLFACALLSKEQSVILLPLFVVADALGVTAQPPGRSVRAWLRRHAVPCLLLTAYLVARMVVIRGQHDVLQVLPKPAVTLLTPVYALQSAFAPTWALVYEPMQASTWLSGPRLLAALALTATLVAVALRKTRRAARVLAFWAAWFLFAMLPSANLVTQDVAFDERYIFVSLLAVVGVAGLAAESFWPAPAPRRWIAAGAFAALAGLTAITMNRGRYFADDLTFTRQWVRTSPDEYLPHYSLGVALAEHGRIDEAMAAYHRALTLNPAWPDTHMNLGALHLQRSEPAAAQARFLDYARLKPNSAKAHYSLGVAQLLLGRHAPAQESFERALALQPRYAEAHHNLAVTHQQSGRIADAIAHYTAALQIDPAKRSSRENLDALLAQAAVGANSRNR